MLPRPDIDSIMNPRCRGHHLPNVNLFRIYTALMRPGLTIFYCRIVIIMHTLLAGPRADPVRLACRVRTELSWRYSADRRRYIPKRFNKLTRFPARSWASLDRFSRLA